MQTKDIASKGPEGFDQYLELISKKPTTFAIRLTDGRPALVFRRTVDFSEISQIKDKAVKATLAVMENNCPPAWKPYLKGDPSIAGRAVHFAERHVGYLKWVDCDQPETPGTNHRKIGEQWQEERIVEERWETLQFLVMAAHDGEAFRALIDGLNAEIGVGVTSDDVSYFQREAQTV